MRTERRWLRRLAAGLALLATLFYTLMAPAPSTTAMRQATQEARLLADLAVAFCHGGRTADTSLPGRGDTPGDTGSYCPVCLGLAAFASAVMPAAVSVPVRFALPVAFDRTAGVETPSTLAALPRARGPPARPDTRSPSET